MSKNTKKNTKGGITGKGFGVSKQPSPAAKKAGWDRRREALDLMNKAKKYADMTVKELKEIMADIKIHPENYTQKDFMMIRYVTTDKHLIDYLNRHIPQAPKEVELTGEISGIDGAPIVVQVMNPKVLNDKLKGNEKTSDPMESSPNEEV